MEWLNKLVTKCPYCKGCKGVAGKSSGPYPGASATLPCKRCDATGEVRVSSLTEVEKNPPLPVRYERDDL